MITIITTKRWKRLLEDMQQMLNKIACHEKALKDLWRKLGRMEKSMNEVQWENRLLKERLKKIEKQQNKK